MLCLWRYRRCLNRVSEDIKAHKVLCLSRAYINTLSIAPKGLHMYGAKCAPAV